MKPNRFALAFVVLACLSAVAADRFFETNKTGTKLDIGRVGGQYSKTIAQWGEQAIKANSKEFRHHAGHVLVSISGIALENEQEKVLPGEIRLTREERQACRDAALPLLSSTDKEVRMLGLDSLRYVGDGDCRKQVAKLTTDRYCGKAACELLGKVGDSTSIPALVAAIENNGGRDPQAAAESLGKIGGKQARIALEKLRKSKHGDPKTSSGEAIAKALDEIEAKE